LSNLILSGQISREEALRELKEPLYSPVELATEKEYILKKLGLNEESFQGYMNMPRIPQAQYGVQPFITDQFPLLKLARPIVRLIKK
jgi:hypothetical protein